MRRQRGTDAVWVICGCTTSVKQQTLPQLFVVAGLTLAGDLGFEPRLSDPESLVLPLHQSPRWSVRPIVEDVRIGPTLEVYTRIAPESRVVATGGRAG